MSVRLNDILRENNISLRTLRNTLNALGLEDDSLNFTTKISDGCSDLLSKITKKDIEFFSLIRKSVHDSFRSTWNQDFSPLPYNDAPSFWIDELVILSPSQKVNIVKVGLFDDVGSQPLYSLLIGSNGVGKSTLLKEIVDFFIDLHSAFNNPTLKLKATYKGKLRGITYHIDGVKCEVIRFEKSYLVRLNGSIQSVGDLRLPAIVGCNFGAFDKFPTQKINGAKQTKYDVPYYKYVGAHVNGSVISSSAIAFRLLFTLNGYIDDRQLENIKSTLDFIGYEHRISLQYSLIAKSKKNGAAREVISQFVEKDREYSTLNKLGKEERVSKLYDYYKGKMSASRTTYRYNIDFDENDRHKQYYDELQIIYKLKQYDLLNSVSVIFHKQGADVQSDEMSSGEFAFLSTVLSISAAARDSHTLVLLDEPELSLHPNWQMTIIDNLDRALGNQACHLIIATHCHMLVSDLPMNRSFVCQLEKDEQDNLSSASISESTYGWSAEEVLFKVFKTATDRNRYFGERIGKLLERMGNNSISPAEIKDELKDLKEISIHLSNIDPMKRILNTILETYR